MSLVVETADTSSTAAGGLSFNLGWSCAAAVEVVVTVAPPGGDPALKELGTDYDLTGDLLGGGGAVVFRDGFQPATGASVRIYRSTPLEQPDSFGSLGAFDPAKVGRAFDRTVRLIQEQRRDLALVAVGGGGEGGGGGGGGFVAWGDITGKPSTFPPAAHTHPQSDIVGLVAALGAKAGQAAVDGKAATDLGNVPDATLRARILATGAVVTASGAGAALPGFTGAALKALRINAAETALEYYTPAGGGGGSGTVDTVNGNGPDGSGDVALSAADIPNAALTDLSNVTTQLTGAAPVIGMPAILSREISLLKCIDYSLHAAIRARTASVSHHVGIQLALDEAESRGGAEVVVEAGLFRFDRTLRNPSNTWLRGLGPSSELRALPGSWNTSALSGTGYERCGILNKHYSAGSITDENTGLEGVLIDMQSLGGDAHCWIQRMVNRPVVSRALLKNAGNGTSMLASKDSLVQDSFALNVANCGFDHWDGFDGGTVSGCVLRGSAAQGIQFTGTGSAYEDRDGAGGLVIGNRIYGVRAASQAGAAIIFNVVDAGSSNRRCKSIGNYVEDADIGLAMCGDGGEHQSIGDTFNNVTKLPIFLQQESAGEKPSGCLIDSPHLINCTHLSGNVALIVASGDGHTIRGLKITGSTTFERRVWFTADASNCILHPVDGAAGTVVNVLDQGTANSQQAYGGGADASWTPALYFGGATSGVSYASRQGVLCRIGNQIFFSGQLVLSSKGSASGAAVVRGLPTPPKSGYNDMQLCVYQASLGPTPGQGRILNTFSGTQAGLGMLRASDGGIVSEADFTNSTILNFSGSYFV